jgi:hypothetical protein
VHLLREEELEARARPEYDFKFAKLDLSLEPEAKRYEAIMDKIVNGWYRLIYRTDPKIGEDGKVLVYIEWMQAYVAIGNSRAVRYAGT